jgi:hypothetical protein
MLKLTDISEGLMMEAVHTSEMSVHFNVTKWLYIPEDSKLRKIMYFATRNIMDNYM